MFRSSSMILWLSSLTVGGALAACGSSGDADRTEGVPDASSSAADAAPTDATSAPDTSTDAQASDAGMPVSCKALLSSSPASPSGIYSVDPDGAGPLPALPVYCDMVFDGGGWTLIFSSIAGLTIDDPGDAGSDAPADAPFYLRPPAPEQLGMFKGEVVQPLAMGASQVHIRTPFAADAGAAGGPAFITSVVLPDGGVTKPIQNLRNLALLNAFGDGTFAEWTGPNAVAERLAYDKSGSCSAMDSRPYPRLYHACNNGAGLHLGSEYSRWAYESAATPDEAMEVYLR